MTDLPPGKFTALMIGPYWPSGISVISTVNAARNRGTVQSFFDDYSRQLLTTRTGPLAPMEGVTAESIRDLFKNGEAQATSVSDKNSVKQKAFSDASDALNGLRSALTQIAAEGNAKIDEIMQSKKNAAQKLGEIVDVISEKQGKPPISPPNMAAKVTEAIQKVLTAEGDTRSPEQFAADNGIDLTSPPTPSSKDTLRGLVEPMLKNSQAGSEGADLRSESSVAAAAVLVAANPSACRDRSNVSDAPFAFWTQRQPSEH